MLDFVDSRLLCRVIELTSPNENERVKVETLKRLLNAITVMCVHHQEPQQMREAGDNRESW